MDDDQRVAAKLGAAASPPSPPACPVSRPPVLPGAAGSERSEPVWSVTDDVNVAPQRTAVSIDIRDMGVW